MKTLARTQADSVSTTPTAARHGRGTTRRYRTMRYVRIFGLVGAVGGLMLIGILVAL
jgi:hypothetical protein